METVNERIDQIVEEFVDLDAREKLELLLDFANRLPPLSADYLAKKENEDRRGCHGHIGEAPDSYFCARFRCMSGEPGHDKQTDRRNGKYCRHEQSL